MPDDSQQKQYDTQIGKLTGQLEAIKSELIEKLADIASLEKDKEEIEERVKKQLVEVTEERDKVREELAGVREQVKQQVKEL
jgi:predicted  nucleic acid-binding Zn-ribbon protein